MAGTSITTSPDISLLNSQIIFDLCQGKIFMDLSPSLWIGDGIESVFGANFQVTNPVGVIVKPYGSNYEVAPGLSGGMDAVISYNVPTIGGNYQYGSYTVSVELYDSAGTRYVVTKTVTICEPDLLNKTRNYGSLSAKLTGVCKDGKLFVIVDGVPNYRGFSVESQVNDFTLSYPTVSEVVPLDSTVTNFTVVLYEGEYILEGTICATYNYGDNVYVKINYKVKKKHIVKCIIDLCCVQQQFTALREKINSDCTDAEKEKTANTIVEALLYIRNAELAADCGQDPSDDITALENLLGCSCTCNCNEGTPIIDLTPSSDVTINGCGVDVVTVGLTKTYTINNFTYVVAITPNGGALTITEAATDGCIKTQTVAFNISVVYSQIKALAYADFNFWATVIRRSLVGLDSTCLGLTTQQYAALTLPQLMQAVFDKFCDCCSCAAILSGVTLEQSGANVIFEWTETDATYSVDLYIDGTFIANILGGVGTYTALDVITEIKHTYRLVPKCSNGSIGTPIEGTIAFTGKSYVAPPSVYTPNLIGVCPYDLTTNVLPLPLGIVAEWHTANNTLPSSLVADPTQAIQSAYFVFAKDSNNFYSTGVQVTLVCDESGSCSAPQNLTVVPAFGGNLVQFQSAAYPPPLNSYTVKRRLESDPDIAGSYTTIGTPVWNASASRWVINDPSAVSNVLYVYRAISNCGGTSPYIDFEFASIICPALELTPIVTDLSYRFVNVEGDVDKYEVSIYESDGVTLIHTDTHLPVFTDAITGIFGYLDPSTTYRVGLKIYIGDYVKDCGQEVTETLSDTATVTLDYVAGIWSLSLSNALPISMVVGAATDVIGSTASDCSDTFETDTVTEMEIAAGDLYAEDETNGLSYLSTYYHIEDNVTLNGIVYNDGDTFVSNGVTITVSIQRFSCSYYPA